MMKYTTVLAGLLSHLSGSDFERAVNAYTADKRVRTFKTYDLFKARVYGQLSSCLSMREIENSMHANGNRLYHAGLQQVKRSTFCDAMENWDHHL
jgi:hypothetical protein